MTIELRPQPRPGVMDIDAYVPGKSVAPAGVARVYKLSSNENPLGASPAAVEAAKAAAERMELYPDGAAMRLRQAIAETHGLNVANIMCFNGSDEALALLTRIYVGPGDEGIYTEHGFLAYKIYIQGVGATPVVAKETAETANVDAILAAVTPRTKIVFLANPNNPTGTYLGGEELERLHRGLRPDILFVLDSAYAEYVTAEDYDVGIGLVSGAENVVMVRTFSKMGLAASRIGWMYAPDHVVDVVNRIRGPFNVNRPAQYAGAAAARDVDFTVRLKQYNAQWRAWLTRALHGNAIRVIDSQANFVLALFDSAQTSKAAFQALFAEGLIVREIGVYGIENGLRISIGPEPAMRRLVEVLKAFGAPGARD